MTALKAHEVARFLNKPDLDEGIFLAYGPDAGLVRESAQRLVRHFTGNDALSMGLIILEGAEIDADPGRLAVEARMVSLFGEKRVIRVRNAGKSLVMTLAELKDNLSGAVIILEGGNLAPKDALRALVEAAPKGRALPCYPDTDETLTALIRDTFAKAGIAVDNDVVPALRDILGNDREITRRELEKLCLYASGTKSLNYNDIIVLCADNAALVVDQIMDSAGTGHAARLEEALNRALNSAVDPQRLLASAAIHFSMLRRLRGEVDAGRSARDVLESARPKPHFSRKALFEQQLRLWNDETLALACERLHLATADSRKRYGLSETILRRTMLSLCMLAAER
jgi:DNA polymerase-3 subunit delta